MKDYVLKRCVMAIGYGDRLFTRCELLAPHPGQLHRGRGIERDPYQIIEWSLMDPKSFVSRRDDTYSWRE